MNTVTRFSTALALAAGLALVPASAPAGLEEVASAEVAARNIFYEPDRPEQPKQLGLRYKILLLDESCELSEVGPGHDFRSGQRFRLQLQANRAGFLYIFHKGSDGAGVKLFPDARIEGGRNAIQAFEEVTVPSSGWFRFDEKVGAEQLYFFVSREPLDGRDASFRQPAANAPAPPAEWRNLEAVAQEAGAVSMGGGVIPAAGTRNVVYEAGAPAAPPAPTAAPGETPVLVGAPTVEMTVTQDVKPRPNYVVQTESDLLIVHLTLQHK